MCGSRAQRRWRPRFGRFLAWARARFVVTAVVRWWSARSRRRRRRAASILAPRPCARVRGTSSEVAGASWRAVAEWRGRRRRPGRSGQTDGRRRCSRPPRPHAPRGGEAVRGGIGSEPPFTAMPQPQLTSRAPRGALVFVSDAHMFIAARINAPTAQRRRRAHRPLPKKIISQRGGEFSEFARKFSFALPHTQEAEVAPFAYVNAQNRGSLWVVGLSFFACARHGGNAAFCSRRPRKNNSAAPFCAAIKTNQVLRR